ncbi:MAG: AAA domain-containing protein [Bacteroides sp.]|nr:AAA domain-containing protein [Bacteroides sp.]
MAKKENEKQLYINGAKCAVWESETLGVAVLGYYSGSLVAEDGSAKEIREKGGNLHGCLKSVRLSSADAAGILELIPGAVIVWEGSKEFNEIREKATGSRPGGRNNGGSGEESAAGVVSSAGASAVGASVAPMSAPVAGSDAFQVPGVEEVSALKNILAIMPALRESLEGYGKEFAGALVEEREEPGMPETVSGAAVLVPALSPAVEAYRAIITRAFEDWKEERARMEAEARAAEEAAKREAAAAANGKNIVKLFDGSTVEVTGRVHPAFAEVLEDLKEFRAVYLYGPAGTGKSFMARQIAEALKLECYISGKSDLKYDLTGAADVNGNHMFTAFTRAWINGGVWLWDEWDRSAADACTAINDALANGRLEVPGLGMVEKHPDFYCIAAGNTCGFGADSKYSAAQKQDYSAGTRFLSKIKIDYCREMDMIVTGDDGDLCDFAAAVREAIEKTGIEIDLAIRALKPLQAKAARRGCKRALECCLFAGLEKSIIRQISSRCIGSNKWFHALEELAA